MLSNAYLLAKIGADTAENVQRFAEILPTDALPEPASDGRSADAGRSATAQPAGCIFFSIARPDHGMRQILQGSFSLNRGKQLYRFTDNSIELCGGHVPAQ